MENLPLLTRKLPPYAVLTRLYGSIHLYPQANSPLSLKIKKPQEKKKKKTLTMGTFA